jgi:hypothetical protein
MPLPLIIGFATIGGGAGLLAWYYGLDKKKKNRSMIVVLMQLQMFVECEIQGLLTLSLKLMRLSASSRMRESFQKRVSFKVVANI